MFFKDWIESDQELSINNCKILKYNEIPEAREKIYDKLVERVIEHYTELERINNYLEDEKFSKLEKHINESLPNMPNHEKGDFGEIFGTEHLKQFYDYTFPIFKLRYKLKPNDSIEGEDILGFYIKNDEITGICVGESKVRTKSNSKVIEEAIDQLEKAYNPYPVLIRFYSKRIYEIDKDLAEKIEDLLSPEFFNQIKKDNWIFLITGFKPRKFKIKDNKLDNLVLINMHFKDLNNFVTALFKDCRGYNHEK